MNIAFFYPKLPQKICQQLIQGYLKATYSFAVYYSYGIMYLLMSGL